MKSSIFFIILFIICTNSNGISKTKTKDWFSDAIGWFDTLDKAITNTYNQVNSARVILDTAITNTYNLVQTAKVQVSNLQDNYYYKANEIFTSTVTEFNKLNTNINSKIDQSTNTIINGIISTNEFKFMSTMKSNTEQTLLKIGTYITAISGSCVLSTKMINFKSILKQLANLEVTTAILCTYQWAETEFKILLVSDTTFRFKEITDDDKIQWLTFAAEGSNTLADLVLQYNSAIDEDNPTQIIAAWVGAFCKVAAAVLKGLVLNFNNKRVLFISKQFDGPDITYTMFGDFSTPTVSFDLLNMIVKKSFKIKDGDAKLLLFKNKIQGMPGNDSVIKMDDNFNELDRDY